jgi:hypothetical protein
MSGAYTPTRARFLAGPEGRYFTGRTIQVNGGLFLGKRRSEEDARLIWLIIQLKKQRGGNTHPRETPAFWHSGREITANNSQQRSLILAVIPISL